MADRPTQSWVMAQLAERRTRLSSLRAAMVKEEDFLLGTADGNRQRLLQHLTGLPPGMTGIKLLPIARDAVDVGKMQVVTGETPTITVELPEEAHRVDDREREAREELEDKLRALSWFVDRHGQAVINELTEHTLAHGLGVLAFPYLPDKMPKHPLDGANPKDAEERALMARYSRARNEAFPFDVRVAHPTTVFWDLYHTQPEDVIEEQTVPSGAFAELLTEDERKVQSVKLVVYCSREWYGCWLGGRPLLTPDDGADGDGIAPNPTGILWYRFAYSGMGTNASDGDWLYRIKGLLRDGLDVIAAYITAYNQMENIRALHAFTTVEIIGETEEARAKAKADSTFGPYGTWEHPPDVRMQYVNPPNVPQVIVAQLEEARRQLEVHFGPEILRGIFRDDTATGQRTRLSQAKAPYRPTKQSVQDCWAGMLMDIQYMVKYVMDEALQIPSPAGGVVTLAPKDIVDNAWTMVDLSPPTQEEKGYKLEDVKAKRELGIISLRRAISDASDGEVDPEEELAQLDAEVLAESPQYQSMVYDAAVQLAAQKLGIDPAALTGGQSPQPQGQSQEQQPAPDQALVAGAGQPLPNGQPVPPVMGSPADMQQQMGQQMAPQMAQLPRMG